MYESKKIVLTTQLIYILCFLHNKKQLFSRCGLYHKCIFILTLMLVEMPMNFAMLTLRKTLLSLKDQS